jgi:hypothetical protein
MNKQKYASMVALTLLLPVVGALIMYGLIFAFPMGEDAMISHIVYTIIIITLGLLVPFGFLKAFSIAAHEWDSNEQELHLEDMPKDKEQYTNTIPINQNKAA